MALGFVVRLAAFAWPRALLFPIAVLVASIVVLMCFVTTSIAPIGLKVVILDESRHC